MNWLAQRFELSRGGDAHNVRPMEGLRGFAVALVFLVHYVTLVTPLLSDQAVIRDFAQSLHTIGNTGVDLFFVLSGYLIYGTLMERQQAFFRFISRRIRRIYPAFIAVFVTYLFLSFLFPAENKIPSGAFDGAVYILQNFLLLPGIIPIEPMITVAWSLSYEMLYYLTIPLIIAAFSLRDRRAALRVGFFMAATLLMVIYCYFWGGHIRLIMFNAGILLHESMRSKYVPTPSSLIGLLALSVGALGVLVPLAGSLGSVVKSSVLFFAFFLVCLACFRDPGAWLPRAFSWTPLRWLGNMSYSYYLLHGLALKAGFMVISAVLQGASFGSWLFWVLLPPMFLLTLVPTSALFLLVERPFSLASKPSIGKTPRHPIEAAPGQAVKSDRPPAARRIP